MRSLNKPVVFSMHALEKMADRGVSEDDVREAIRIGMRQSARRGLWQFRLNREFQDVWRGKHYGVKQVMPIVADETDRYFVVTVYSFYFQEG